MADVIALGMIVSIISFLGFVVENIWLAATKGYVDNRGMCFPFLIGYGVAALMIYGIFGTPQKLCFFKKVIRVQNRMIRLLVYFTEVMLCVCIGEILLGTFVEKVCHFYWWDYSCVPLHLTRYTSIPTSAVYSILITFFMDTLFVPLCSFFQKQNSIIFCIVTVLLLALMVADYLYNVCMMYRTHGMVRRWRINIGRIGYIKI
ncbi:MAG: putative ABC transporter permease [Muribaculum sp.]|nr:putative ABC transporter permease [Muribaculum sp.]